jgi:tRNA (cytosine38-C5)-methyltransferase
MKRRIRAVEFFSGTGGLQLSLCKACQSLGREYTIDCAIDINGRAVAAYSHNFPSHRMIRKTIDHLSSTQLNPQKSRWNDAASQLSLSNDDEIVWLMSPPCQPFVLNGRNADTQDNRNSALFHVIDLICECKPHHVFLENVAGFAASDTRNRVVEQLHAAGYATSEVVVSPLQFGIPNDRKRFYMVASLNPEASKLTIPELASLPWLSKYLDEPATVPAECWLTSEQLDLIIHQQHHVDLVFPWSTTSSAFTKSYGDKWNHFRGTGSLLCLCSPDEVTDSHERFHNVVDSMRGRIRYFTPREIMRIHGYPSEYSFPDSFSCKDKWALLGNGVNVDVCAHLMTCMLTNGS